MRVLRYLPLAFLAGVHGFDLFAPYLALFLAAVYALNGYRRSALVHVPVEQRRD